MKNFLCCLFLIFCIQDVIAQDNIPSSLKENIVGRWFVFQSGDSIRADSVPAPSAIYFFKDDTMFHIGEVNEGVILFNITGRYAVNDNIVEMTYRNYLHPDAGSKSMTLIVHTIAKNEMVVSIKDYDYTYIAVLRKYLIE